MRPAHSHRCTHLAAMTAPVSAAARREFMLDTAKMACGMGVIAEGELLDCLRRAACFGLFLVRLDVRQDAARHASAMTEITDYLGLGRYADWDEEHPAGSLLDDILLVRLYSYANFIHEGYPGKNDNTFLSKRKYLSVIKKLMSELTPADMEMIYCCEVNDFSTDTLYPVIVFTSAPTLEKEHTLTLRWTTVEGDVKTASVTCTPEVDPALQ